MIDTQQAITIGLALFISVWVLIGFAYLLYITAVRVVNYISNFFLSLFIKAVLYGSCFIRQKRS